jgi:predicted methyltransferase MtxX (methanogen marker protein 4)
LGVIVAGQEHKPGNGEQMADLKVDYQLLDSIERDLSNLVSQFEHIETQTESYDEAMGSSDIVSAMGSFSGNWVYHRKQMVGSMQTLGQLVSSTKTYFQDTDNRLKSSLTKK